MQRKLALLALMTLAGPVVAQDIRQQGRSITWPSYSDQQRWNRENTLAIGFYASTIAYGKARGQTVDEIGRWFGDIYAPGWGSANSGVAVRVARGFLLNVAAMPGADANLVSANDTSAMVRFRRVHVAQFGPTGEMYGVKVAEYDRFFDLIGERINGHLGLRYTSRIDGDWNTMTFTGRGSAANATFPRGTFTFNVTPEQAGSPADVGTYELTFAPDGHFELTNSARQSKVRGKYDLWLDQITLRDETGEFACPSSGVYRFSTQTNGDVSLGRLADSCDGRVRFIGRRLAKK